MSRNLFTEEQQHLFRNNSYVYSVTALRLQLTKEFIMLYRWRFPQRLLCIGKSSPHLCKTGSEPPIIMNLKKLRQSMSHRGNCWNNAPQENFFGHMKDRIKAKLADCIFFNDVLMVIDDYIDCYYNHRYQWHLAKLSPNEYNQFVTTGKYPLGVPNMTELPVIAKKPAELGVK